MFIVIRVSQQEIDKEDGGNIFTAVLTMKLKRTLNSASLLLFDFY